MVRCTKLQRRTAGPACGSVVCVCAAKGADLRRIGVMHRQRVAIRAPAGWPWEVEGRRKGGRKRKSGGDFRRKATNRSPSLVGRNPIWHREGVRCGTDRRPRGAQDQGSWDRRRECRGRVVMKCGPRILMRPCGLLQCGRAIPKVRARPTPPAPVRAGGGRQKMMPDRACWRAAGGGSVSG